MKGAKFSIFFLCYVCVGWLACPAWAQGVRIDVPPRTIALNEPFVVTVESDGQEITNHSPFPDLDGFKKVKSGFSSHETEVSFQGKKRKVYILEQVYHPLREGIIQIKPFEMSINNKSIKATGASIRIKPFDKLKGELTEPREHKNEEKKTIEVREDAFLALDVNKTEAFVGEGICVSLSLYVSKDNPAPMKYVDLNKQVEEISKKIKPANCWEENFNIVEVPELPRVNLHGKIYFQNKFYEAVFFPLNAQSIEFPAIELKMLVKKKILGRDNINEFKQGEGELTTFVSEPKQVQIKALPEHPLRDKVAVGRFFLQEDAPSRIIKTGEGINYYFKIVGEGNIATLYEPQANNNSTQLLIYPPNLQTAISRAQGAVTGSVVFEYPIVPQEAGKHSLHQHFEWIFFNLATQRYDTLRPQSYITVSGESYKGAGGLDMKTHPLYRKMNQQIAAVTREGKQNWLFFFNMTAGVMAFFLLLTFLRRAGKSFSRNP